MIELSCCLPPGLRPYLSFMLPLFQLADHCLLHSESEERCVWRGEGEGKKLVLYTFFSMPSFDLHLTDDSIGA